MRRSHAAALLAAALAAAAVAGCGKEDNTKSTTTGQANAPAAAKPDPNKGKAPDLNNEKVGATGSTVAGSYVGMVSKTNAYLAIVVRNGRAVAFMNDGLQFAQHFTGPVAKGGVLKLKSEGQVKLDAKVGSARAGGAVRLAGGTGDQLTFDARPARIPDGFYRGTRTYRGQPVVAEWVVINSKTQHGVITVGGKPRKAPALTPGRKFAVIPGLGRIRVQRVASPADVKF